MHVKQFVSWILETFIESSELIRLLWALKTVRLWDVTQCGTTFPPFTVFDRGRETAFDGLCGTQLTVSSVTEARARAIFKLRGGA